MSNCDIVVVVTPPGAPIVVEATVVGQSIAVDATTAPVGEEYDVTLTPPTAIAVAASPPVVISVDAVAYNGPPGPPGDQGPTGSGGPVASVARKIGDVLIYTADIEDWQEGQVLDGGNF